MLIMQYDIWKTQCEACYLLLLMQIHLALNMQSNTCKLSVQAKYET